MRLYLSGATGYLGSFLSRLMSSCNVEYTPISFFNPLNPNYISSLDALDPNSVLIHLSDNSFPSLARELSCSSSEVFFTSSLSSKFKKVIYFSSSAVYEVSSETHHLSESSNYLSNSVYAKNKLHLESLFNPSKDLILRPTNLYCDFPKKGTILFDLYLQKINQQTFSLTNPSVMIDFLDVHYVFEFLLYALKNSLSGVFNLASGKYISGFQLISCFNDPYGSRLDFDDLPPSPFSIDKLEKLSDFAPPISLFTYKPYFIYS